jgi:hypothetical protein
MVYSYSQAPTTTAVGPVYTHQQRTIVPETLYSRENTTGTQYAHRIQVYTSKT